MYLRRASDVIGLCVTSNELQHFINSRRCSQGGKHAYFRHLKAFYNWLYSRKSVYNQNPQSNPILAIDPPKVERKILPSLTIEQIANLITASNTIRDKCIISLFADSGLRLAELASIRNQDIDWENHTITVWGKGNKQRKAPFTGKTASLLRNWLGNNGHSQGIWGINSRGISIMLERLGQGMRIKCNPHVFRRGFACNLHRKGLSTLDIMHLGGWSSLSMVLKYCQSISFEDCLKHYRKIEGN
ncbi:tyrosine-type recombinase/integrase [Chloroflexota bacterium]